MLAVLVVQLGAAAAQAAAGECGNTVVAVGSYTGVSWIPEASGEGVTLLDLELCNTQGTLSGTLVESGLIPTTKTGENPSYCDEVDSSTIICANEIADGTATMVGTNSTATSQTFDLGVSRPTHISVLDNGIVATANFGGSFGTFMPSAGSATSVVQTITVPDTGSEPHPHMILQTAVDEIVVTDVGTDAVYQYSVAEDGSLTETGVTTLPAGSGPRHAALGMGGKVYVAAEKVLQIVELGSDCTEGAEGTARGICGFKQLTETMNGTTFQNIAAIRVSKDQEFVYASLREDAEGEFGGIAGLQLSANGSLGDPLATAESGGKTPRDMNLVDVPGFKEVFVVANRKSDTVVVFDRDEATGEVGSQLASAAVNTPTSVLPLGRDDEAATAASAPAPAAAATVADGAAAPVDGATDGTAAGPVDGTVSGDQSGTTGADSSASEAEGTDTPLPSAAAATTFHNILVVVVVLLFALVYGP